MQQLFASGHVIDLILLLMLAEAALLLKLRLPGLGSRQILALLLPGAFLMLAVRAALTSAHWTTIAACLLAALVAHLGDVWIRIRNGDRR